MINEFLKSFFKGLEIIGNFKRRDNVKEAYKSAQENRFEEALEKLKDKMLIMGYRDYDKVCAGIGSLIGGEKERKK